MGLAKRVGKLEKRLGIGEVCPTCGCRVGERLVAGGLTDAELDAEIERLTGELGYVKRQEGLPDLSHLSDEEMEFLGRIPGKIDDGSGDKAEDRAGAGNGGSSADPRAPLP